MDSATYLELIQQYPPEPDPRFLEQRTAVVNAYLRDPLLRERVMKPLQEDAAREAAHDDARKSLRVVLAARGLSMSAEQEARIDAQDDIDVLHRWHTQAVTAASVGKALT